MGTESGTGELRQRFDEPQVVEGRDHRDMPQVGAQVGKLRPHIGAVTVPADEGVDGETETEVVNTRGTTVGLPDSGNIEEKTQVSS